MEKRLVHQSATHKRGFGERVKRTAKFLWLRVLRIRASEHNVARGLAAGVYVGLLPVLPFQTVIAVALAFVVRGSKIAAALGTWVSNPLNWVPCYLMFYYVGKLVLPLDVPPLDLDHVEMKQLIEAGWKMFAVMMVGGTVVGIPSAAVSYFAALKAVRMYRERKEARRSARRRAARAA